MSTPASGYEPRSYFMLSAQSAEGTKSYPLAVPLTRPSLTGFSEDSPPERRTGAALPYLNIAPAHCPSPGTSPALSRQPQRVVRTPYSGNSSSGSTTLPPRFSAAHSRLSSFSASS